MPHSSTSAAKIRPPEQSNLAADPWSWHKVRALLSVFGPAAIVASVAIGAGETIMVVRAGAWAGYGLLWLVLLSALVKGVFVTYLLGRYTAVSGELLGERLVKLPGPRGWLLILLLVLELAAAGPLWAAISRPCGELVRHVLESWGEPFALDPRVFSTLFVLLALGLSLLITYDRLERQQLFICSVLVLGTVVGTLMVHPDVGATLRGLFSVGKVPQLLEAAPAEVRANPLPLLAVTFGYVGGSVMTYLVYADWIALHGWGLTGHPQIEEIRDRAAQGKPGDYVLMATLAVLWSDWDFHLLTLIVAFLATNLGVALAMLAALYLNYQLPAPYRTRWWMLVGGVLSAVLLLAVSVISGRAMWSELQRALSSGAPGV